MKIRRIAVTCAAFAVVLIVDHVCDWSRAYGQTVTERVLVPVFAETPAPGAFGSLWRTEVIGRNDSDHAISVAGGPGGCPLPEGCISAYQAAHSTFKIGGFNPLDPNAGIFLYIDAPSDLIEFNLRIRDLSRQALTWGTSIPVIRERQTYTSSAHLLGVPIDARFRDALRIYDFNFSQDGTQIRLRIYEENSKEPLVDSVVTLPPTRFAVGINPQFPSAISFSDIVASFPQLATLHPIQAPGAPAEARVRIDIDPISPGLEFWAFASVTNNETQHVTVITPDPPPSR